jgi:hypothetical protein
MSNDNRLMMVLSGVPALAVCLVAGPMLFAHRVSGYVPRALRYSFESYIPVQYQAGQETKGKRAWGGFATAIVK